MILQSALSSTFTCSSSPGYLIEQGLSHDLLRADDRDWAWNILHAKWMLCHWTTISQRKWWVATHCLCNNNTPVLARGDNSLNTICNSCDHVWAKPQLSLTLLPSYLSFMPKHFVAVVASYCFSLICSLLWCLCSRGYQSLPMSLPGHAIKPHRLLWIDSHTHTNFPLGKLNW